MTRCVLRCFHRHKQVHAPTALSSSTTGFGAYNSDTTDLNEGENNEEEKKTSLTRLKIVPNSITPQTNGKHLREVLRKQSFQSWCQLPHKDKGVCTYEECPKANSWISSKKCLSSSEYINAIKMSCNVTAVRSVPGRTFSTNCRRHPGCSETETLGHVLGFCNKGELLRNNRHYRARTAIANLLRNRGWEVHEEIHCVSEDYSHRRVDIIAINRRNQKAMVLDPTICFERDTNQTMQITTEQNMYLVFHTSVKNMAFRFTTELFQAYYLERRVKKPKATAEPTQPHVKMNKGDPLSKKRVVPSIPLHSSAEIMKVHRCRARLACLTVKPEGPGSNPGWGKLPG
ncbi:hypothetical protein ANN_11743 [Periplaneta americana]|uniref:Uncharacterized protein n=1 Tax=Periplaneta americana TaxID=6978 RepID=A0ABQ8T5X1_PERAM|nr:hypothetical protein ANN_11743 [Periplaneta americana]